RLAEPAPHRLPFFRDHRGPRPPLVGGPKTPRGPGDPTIVESPYAARQHESVADAAEELGELVRRVAARGGKVLVPAFAIGRAQELIYALHQLWRAQAIPEVPIYLDSPLRVDVTTVFRLPAEVFD